MTRVLSAAALLPVVLGTVWWLPAWATLALAEVAALVAFLEYARLAARLGAAFPRAVPGAATLACCAALGGWQAPSEAILLAALVAVAARAVGAGRIGPATLHGVAAALLAPLYLGLPLGTFVAVRTFEGREAALVFLLAIMASDTAQYYGGRGLGRRPLAPAVSPKKTVEGVLAGVLAAPLVTLALGRRWLAPVDDAWLVAIGVSIAVFGVVGDLFESLLKRSADLKDTGDLIPGHGGLLDRIDSWLFAAPAYYVLLRALR
jgi:phosphatidate cytidylyltransferase